MSLRIGAFALLALLPACPALAQVGARRETPKAFPPSITPFVGLGFGGQRAIQMDAEGNRLEHKLGSAPHGGVEIQLPIAGTLGLSLTGTVGRPARVSCVSGTCASAAGRLTQVHAAGLVLWRFKARAPIYFGLGAGASHASPGPVVGQDDAKTEIGGVAVLAYDFRVAPRVGLRIAWWNWVTRPSDESLPTGFTAKSLAWDTMVAFGASFSLGT